MQFSSKTEHSERARSIQARIAMLGLWLPYGALWANDIETELLKFPTGRHDDIVDTLSLIGRMIAGLEKGKEPSWAEPQLSGEMTLNELVAAEERSQRIL